MLHRPHKNGAGVAEAVILVGYQLALDARTETRGESWGLSLALDWDKRNAWFAREEIFLVNSWL